MPASTFQQQKLRVCEVCSAYLGLHDNDRRLADHFGGKLHLGFIEIREKLEKLRVSRAVRSSRFRPTGLKESPGIYLRSFFVCLFLCFVLYRKQLWRSKKKCERGDERSVKKKSESVSGRWSERGNGNGRENGRENETESENAGGEANDLSADYFCAQM